MDQQNKNCLITDIAFPSDKGVYIEQEINNSIVNKTVSSSGMKILLVEDEQGKSCPFCFGHVYYSKETGVLTEKR